MSRTALAVTQSECTVNGEFGWYRGMQVFRPMYGEEGFFCTLRDLLKKYNYLYIGG